MSATARVLNGLLVVLGLPLALLAGWPTSPFFDPVLFWLGQVLPSLKQSPALFWGTTALLVVATLLLAEIARLLAKAITRGALGGVPARLVWLLVIAGLTWPA